MNKKAEIQLVAIVALVFFFATLYALNYELPKKNILYLNLDGFNARELVLKESEYLNIQNNSSVSRTVFVDGKESPLIKPEQFVSYKLIEKGEVFIEIRDQLTINAVVKVKVE